MLRREKRMRRKALRRRWRYAGGKLYMCEGCVEEEEEEEKDEDKEFCVPRVRRRQQTLVALARIIRRKEGGARRRRERAMSASRVFVQHSSICARYAWRCRYSRS